jgi:hypothetical protein
MQGVSRALQRKRRDREEEGMGSFTAAREATGYTHIRRDPLGQSGPACDLLLSDEGVLYTAAAGSWRCLGLIDPELLLDDLGVLDGSAAGLMVEDVPPSRIMPLMA